MVSCGGKGNAQDVFLALRPEMRTTRWRQYFRQMTVPYFFYSPEDYRKWLPQAGFDAHRVRLVPKDATFDDRAGLAAWLRTTWLPYVQRVPERERDALIDSIINRYLTKHSSDAKGRLRVGMVRLEINATRRSS
jgi:hypothetical protein